MDGDVLVVMGGDVFGMDGNRWRGVGHGWQWAGND